MILPPQQTKYCKMTKKAIRGFDHHCLFLEKSIGHGTHHYFMLFMMTQGQFSSDDLKMTWPYILVANQFWYVYCLYYMAWPPAGMETALAVFCCFGFCSGSFLIAIQLRCILRRGTQYFPGKSPPRKVFEDFIGPFLKIQSYSYQLRNVLIFSPSLFLIFTPRQFSDPHLRRRSENQSISLVTWFRL